MSYKVTCAWCGVYVRRNPTATEISHGICGDCLKQQLAEAEAFRALPTVELAKTRAALRLAIRDAEAEGYDWLSSRGSGQKVDLTEVCG